MGEVYRARDTRLKREVALKVLPEAFTRDPDRLARFKREAQVLASLNHPLIGAIYGFEDSSEIYALVLELVEGDTLADRIARGPIPLSEAAPIARQICQALEAAHEQGIVHRDLKPANIKITPDGDVKVLDFGLAKLAHPDAAAGQADVTASPTITSPAAMTGVGVLLGTAAYMSPEQAKGRIADKRSDVWAFGCVLYEMLTGRRAFDGEDMTEVLGAVVRLEPNWEALPAGVPQPIRTLLHQCLVKDRRKRIADTAAALFVLDHHASMAATNDMSPAPQPRRAAWLRIAAGTAAAVMVAVLGGAVVWFATRPTPPSVTRTTIVTAGAAALARQGQDRNIAITPDGSHVVYRGNNQLLVRALDQLEPTVLTGLGAPRAVFLSADGQWIGFVDGNTMKRVAITGGPAATLGEGAVVPRGATWGPDGTIVFATTSPSTGLLRMSASGGEPTLLTVADRERGENDHFWPEFLPGGQAVLFTIIPITGGIANAQIAVLDLRTGTSKVLIRGGSHAHYVPTGHLVYGVAGTLRAVAFDLGRLEAAGTPTLVVDGVMTSPSGAIEAAISANGSLVYLPGGAGIGEQLAVVSVDRQGHASPLQGLPLDSYRDVRVSPDGARLVLGTQGEIWIYDFARATLSRPTTDPTATRPLWTPDGQRIVFTSRRAGFPELFWRAADGSGSEERLLTRERNLTGLRANGWSADGKQLLYAEVSAASGISHIPIERPADAKALVKGDSPSAISPDGRWMAYESNVSGRTEIWVERYPELGIRQVISTSGGRLPIWSPNGRELFFSSVDARQMMAVPVQLGTTVVAGRPQVLFEFGILPILAGARSYDLAPNGRFVIIRSDRAQGEENTAPQIVVVQNWFEELKRLVPAK
jgi:serine/threonine-protein kinase